MRSVSGASPALSPTSRMRFHAYIISGPGRAVNPAKVGDPRPRPTTCWKCLGGGSKRFACGRSRTGEGAFRNFEGTFKSRIGDADESYRRSRRNR